MSRSRDAEYTEHVAARLSSLRRLAAVLCDDWQRGDDLVQAALIKLYADGLSIYIMEFGKHPAISVTALFGHHMRLLSRHPANWTRNPIR